MTTSIVIREPEFFEFIMVASRLRHEDARELSLTRKDLDQPTILASDAWGGSVYRRVALLDERPVFAFGATRVNDLACAQVWGFGAPEATRRVMRAVTKTVLRSMIPELLERGFSVAQALVSRDNDLSNRWLRHLGFLPEAISSGVGGRHEDGLVLLAVTAERCLTISSRL
jgi:hypothetical protein